MRMRFLVFLAAAVAAFGADAPSLTKDLQPIFEANCAGCHATNVKMGSLDLDSYASILKGGNHGAVVVPGKSAESRLYLMISGKMTPAMPLGNKPLAVGDIETIRAWIDAGAPAPAAGEEKPRARAGVPDIQPKRPVHAQINAMSWRNDGKLLALGTFQEVRLVDPSTGATVATLKGHAEQVRAVAFSADGKLLAAAGGLPAQSGEIKIWDVESRKELLTIKGHTDCIYAVAFSPDGKTLATSSYDKLIYLWDATSGAKLKTLKDHIDAIYALAFTPDGKRLISASADRGVKVWDAASGERLYTMSEPIDGLNTVAVDSTGHFVAAGGLDKTLRIWELGAKEGKLARSLIAHEDAVLQVAFSPDGKLLLSTSADKTVKVFNAADLSEVKTFAHQPDWVMSLAISPDGKRFACGRFDGSLDFYDMPAPAAHVALK
jgi:Planctomycete cytochrome C/WD domain, G-beta repeat